MCNYFYFLQFFFFLEFRKRAYFLLGTYSFSKNKNSTSCNNIRKDFGGYMYIKMNIQMQIGLTTHAKDGQFLIFFFLKVTNVTYTQFNFIQLCIFNTRLSVRVNRWTAIEQFVYGTEDVKLHLAYVLCMIYVRKYSYVHLRSARFVFS